MSFEYYTNKKSPSDDNFYMPAEFSGHRGTVMIWPYREGSWPYRAKRAEEVFTEIIENIARYEEVILIVNRDKVKIAKEKTKEIRNIRYIEIENDDAWARDTVPTFIVDEKEEIRCIDWEFNAWGGEYDGLYANYENDNSIGKKLAKELDIKCYKAKSFVLEGGSIHTNGEGTLLVTEECLLSKGRNPKMGKEDIEEKINRYVGTQKVIWLPKGIYNDETNGHVDNICAFISPLEVVLAWTDDKNDPQYEISKDCLKVLENSTDNKGRKFTIHKLPIPKTTVCINEDDLQGYVFEEGEDRREVGERLAASYVNFYFCNEAIIMPQFGGENEESDKIAVSIMKKLCKDRKIIPIYARDIIVGGGNIHCITQQIPKGEFNI